MIRLICICLICATAASACGVQGDLYLPHQKKPAAKERSHKPKPTPFPSRPIDDQEVLPDVI